VGQTADETNQGMTARDLVRADRSLRRDPALLAASTVARTAGTAGRLLTLGLPARLNRPIGGGPTDWTPGRVDPADPPWCPPDGASWVIHSDPAGLIGGFLALWVQSLDPLTLAGVMEHSDFGSDPMGRLQRTASFVGTTTFAPGSISEQMCADIRRVHGYVRGNAPDGRPYSADDPWQLDWVHCALLISVGRAWLLYGQKPDTGLLDDYVAEQARVPIALGDPDPPMSWAGLLDRIEEHRSGLAVNDQTRWMGRWLAHPPLPGGLAVLAPLYGVAHAAAIAAGPGWARRLWGVSQPRWPGRLAGRTLADSFAALTGATGLQETAA